jgi:hypothetical protein
MHATEDMEGKYHIIPCAKVVFKGEEKKTQVYGI